MRSIAFLLYPTPSDLWGTLLAYCPAPPVDSCTRPLCSLHCLGGFACQLEPLGKRQRFGTGGDGDVCSP
jgi:hypothetical protein